MSEPILKCSTCKNEIPVGKYYELHGYGDKMGSYCSPCWDKEKARYEVEIKNGVFKVTERERERERESKIFVRNVKTIQLRFINY